MDEIDSVARKAAAAASAVLMEHYGKVQISKVETKAKNDFVSFVDREAEKAIINTVRETFKNHAFLTEEDQAAEATKGEYRWVIDPLDGTTNYLRMHHRFSVSIGVEKKGVLIYGLVLDVMHDDLFTASLGHGAYLNDKRIQVSEASTLTEALVLFGTPFRQERTVVEAYAALYGNVQNAVSDHRREGSAALDLASVACGRAEAFYELGLKPWDVAAGQIILKEAGGWAGDFYGPNEDIFRDTFLATTPKLKDGFLSILSKWKKQT
ncbi:MAG: inositol monophosphatase [Fibrobacteres bacterium]|nr:inositol monophosphatase [Fibrobacterota bacterium]